MQQVNQAKRSLLQGKSKIVDLDDQLILSENKDIEKSYSFYDENAVAISDSGLSWIYEDGDNYIFRTYFEDGSWALITVIPKKDFIQSVYPLWYFALVLLLVVCLIAIWLSDYYARKMLRPIYAIKKSIEEIRLGNIKGIKLDEGEDDVKELSNDITNAISTMDRMLNEIYSGKM